MYSIMITLRGRLKTFRPPYVASSWSSTGHGSGTLEGNKDGSGDGMPIFAGPHLFNGKDEDDTNGWGCGSSYSKRMVEDEYGSGGLSDHF